MIVVYKNYYYKIIKSIKIILLIILISSSTITKSQVPVWTWAKGMGGLSDDKEIYLAIDKDANVYITGYYYSSSISFDNYDINNKGMFIAKYNPNGDVLWVKSIPSDDNTLTQSYGITTDANGNVYITGVFFGASTTFGTISINNSFNNGSADCFIVKYNTDGNVLWAKSAGGNRNDHGFSVVTDKANNVYVTGDFYSSSIIFGTSTLTNNGSQNLFITKFDSNGNVIWAKKAGGSGADNSLCITADKYSNIYITGYFYSPQIIFGKDTLTNTDNTSNLDDMFIAKYDSSGHAIWAKYAGGNDHDFGMGLTTDDADNIYVTGGFYSSYIKFHTDTLHNINAPNSDIFLAKYDSLGNLIWTKSAGGQSFDKSHNVTFANHGIYIIGYFGNPSVTFDTVSLINTINSSAYYSFDLFLVKYDTSGNVIWGKSFGGHGSDGQLGDQGPNVKADKFGNIYVIGFYQDDSITFGSNTLRNNGYNDIFIAKLQDVVTRIENAAKNNNLNIFPNPFNSSAIIQLNTSVINAEMNVFNLAGQKVITVKNIDGTHIKIFKGNLPSGTYFIQLIEKNKILAIEKVIITD